MYGNTKGEICNLTPGPKGLKRLGRLGTEVSTTRLREQQKLERQL